MSKIYVDSIASKTGAADALSIASNGTLTSSKPVGFKVTQRATSSNPSVLPHDTYERIVTMDTTNGFDTHGGWSDSTDCYTVPTGCAGYWFVKGQVEIEIQSGLNYIIIGKVTGSLNNGSNWWVKSGHLGQSNSLTNNILQTSTVLYLDEGDVITLGAYHDYGSDRDYHGSEDYDRTFLLGWRMF